MHDAMRFFFPKMVSFSCEVCNDTVVKKKLAQHQGRCNGAYFTCIDCNTTFYNNEHNQHTSCITEAQKYEKALYKPKKKEQRVQQEVPKKAANEEKVVENKKEKKDKKDHKDKKEKVESPTEQLVALLKNQKPTNFKKVIKKLPKSKQKELIKSLKVVKNEDNTITLHF